MKKKTTTPKITFEDHSVRINGRMDWTHKLAREAAEGILYNKGKKKGNG